MCGAYTGVACARSSAWTPSRARRCTQHRRGAGGAGHHPRVPLRGSASAAQRDLVDNSVIMSLVNMSMNRRARAALLAACPGGHRMQLVASKDAMVMHNLMASWPLSSMSLYRCTCRLQLQSAYVVVQLRLQM